MHLRRAAVSLRDAAERELGVRPKIKTGSFGEMTVSVDGVNVFSHKKKEGGMPGTEELLRRIVATRP